MDARWQHILSRNSTFTTMVLQQLYQTPEARVEFKDTGVGLFHHYCTIQANYQHHKKDHP